MHLDRRHLGGEVVDTAVVDPHILAEFRIPVELHIPGVHRFGRSDVRPTLRFLDTARAHALREIPSRARGSGAYLSHARQTWLRRPSSLLHLDALFLFFPSSHASYVPSQRPRHLRSRTSSPCVSFRSGPRPET